MAALAKWNPQPLVPQPVFAPIKRTYQLARLHEQLQTATNGGRVNIFRVVGFGAQRLPDYHPGSSAAAVAADDAAMMMLDSEDAPGEPDPAAMAMMNAASSRRSSSSFSQPPQRQPSVASHA